MAGEILEQRTYHYPDREKVRVTYQTPGKSRKSQVKSIYIDRDGWERIFRGVIRTETKYLPYQVFNNFTGHKLLQLRQGPAIVADTFHPRKLTPGITLVYSEHINRPDSEGLDIYMPLTNEMILSEEEFGWDSGYDESEYRYPDGREHHAHCSILSVGDQTYLLYDRPVAYEGEKCQVEYRPDTQMEITAEP